MTLNALRRLALGLACALALAGCGSDGGDGTTPDVPADVQALGSELVQTASTDPLTDLKDLPDTVVLRPPFAQRCRNSHDAGGSE